MNSELPNDRLQNFENICHENGLSITPQRVAIYKELIASSEHPSAASIFNSVREYYKNISLDTVNRTLLKFQEIGLAKVVESSGHPKSFDPNLEPHHHFRCVRCGKIYDFKDEVYDALALPESIKGKFIILDKIVHLEGICDACREDR
ncbi:transcriptional repressor [Desulfosarcina widdelii]|uniref:Transcriptional repressor n=1 Tax=Desulfosarcina widdelii TaxID=947919 RepID=A0A5K7Z0T1_9BACT|nr:transcriptional repressor [Desulfosarcina widdelii]BBO75296.1 transcriptional repressor [Desulfosarcina widdelii]